MDVRLEVELFSNVIEDSFGLISSKILINLAEQGSSTLDEIISQLSFPFGQIRNALLTLIQHNLVNANYSSNIYRYTLNVEELRNRLQYASYTFYILSHFNEISSLIFLFLIKVGRSTLVCAVDQIYNDIHNSEEYILNLFELFDGTDVTKEQLKEAFTDLVIKKYVIEARNPNETSKVTTAKIYSEKKKKTDFALSMLNETKTDSQYQNQQQQPQKKRKINTDKQNKRLIEEYERRNTVFSINSSFLNMALLKDKAEHFMKTRWADSQLAQFITRALVSNSYIENSRIISEGLPFDDIRDKLLEFGNESGDAVMVPDKNTCLQLLEALGKNDQLIQSETVNGISVFKFNWLKFISIMRSRQMFNAITAKLSVKGARVWNLLATGKPLAYTYDNEEGLWEEQYVADQTLMSPHLARTILYKLASMGYIRSHQSDVISSNHSFSNKHSMVFTVDLNHSYKKLISDIYVILLNLLLRKKHENKQIDELMFKTMVLSNIGDYSLRQREVGEDCLEYSFLRLCETLMILSTSYKWRMQ